MHKNLVNIERVVPEISLLTERQRQTDMLITVLRCPSWDGVSIGATTLCSAQTVLSRVKRGLLSLLIDAAESVTSTCRSTAIDALAWLCVPPPTLTNHRAHCGVALCPSTHTDQSPGTLRRVQPIVKAYAEEQCSTRTSRDLCIKTWRSPTDSHWFRSLEWHDAVRRSVHCTHYAHQHAKWNNKTENLTNYSDSP